MALRIRLAITGALVAVVAVAVAGTGLGSAVMVRLSAHAASAAAPPGYVDMSAWFRSDPGWETAQGLIAPGPVEASRDVASPAQQVPVLNGYLPLGSALLPPTSGQTAFRNLNLSRAGLPDVPACSGAACGTDGCGFLAPGCALLDCGLLNPACGLGVPVGVTSCGFFGSGCFGFDEEHALFEELRLGEILDSDRHLFDHGFFDHGFFDHHRSHHHD
jgi:hypothetical protein